MKQEKYKHGFKVPEDYFQNLEEGLMAAAAASDLPKATGFSAPNDYFNNLESNIIKRLQEQAEPTKVINLVSRKAFYYVAGIAASIAIIFSLSPFKTNTFTLDTIDITSIETYIDEGNLDLSSYDITSLMDQGTIDDLSIEAIEFSSENLENYLIENIDDTSILIE